MERDLQAVAGQLSTKIDNLFPGPMAGKGKAVKVQGLQLKTPLHGQPPGHGAVDAPGKQQQGGARYPQGEAAGSAQAVVVKEGFRWCTSIKT